MHPIDHQSEWSDRDPPVNPSLDPFDLRRFNFLAGTQISSANTPTPFLLRSGWAFQQFVKPGGQRQILGLMLPGEAFLCYSRFALTAGTDCEVDIPAQNHWKSFVAAYPPASGGVDDFQTAQLWRLAFGRTTSNERVAFLLCELTRRLVPDTGNAAPIRLNIMMERQDIADICCLSAAHVIRTMQELEGLKVIQRCFKGVIILDVFKLRKIAGIQNTTAFSHCGDLDEGRNSGIDRP